MKQNYFDYNGKRYYSGTIIVVQDYLEQKEATFVCYDTEKDWMIYKIVQCNNIVGKEDFFKYLIRVTDKVNPNVKIPQEVIAKDSEINGLSLGWAWYIVIMLIATIFNGNVGIWIITSIIFFTWRSDKIKKEGTYVEW